MNIKAKLGLLLVAAIMFLGGFHFIDRGVELATPTDRVITLTDVSVTVKSVKKNVEPSFLGLFVDAETSVVFTDIISESVYRDFISMNSTPFVMHRSLSLDTVNNNSTSNIFKFFGVFFCFIGSVFIMLVAEYIRSDIKEARAKRKLNTTKPTT